MGVQTGHPSLTCPKVLADEEMKKTMRGMCKKETYSERVGEGEAIIFLSVSHANMCAVRLETYQRERRKKNNENGQ